MRKQLFRNKDRQIEDEAEKNDSELKFFKQKVKHLQFEHQNELTEAKTEALVSLKMAQDDYTTQERQLLKDKRDLKSNSRETELAHEEQIKALKLVCQNSSHLVFKASENVVCRNKKRR